MTDNDSCLLTARTRTPWNKGKLTGAKPPLRPKHVSAIRTRTGRPVKFELTDQTRQAVDDYLRASGKKSGEFLFTSRRRTDNCMTTRQYARLVGEWIGGIGLDPRLFGTHSLRRHEPQEVGTKNASERQLRAAAKAALRKANKKHALTAMPRARPRVREAPSSAVLYLCNVLRIGVSGVGVTPT